MENKKENNQFTALLTVPEMRLQKLEGLIEHILQRRRPLSGYSDCASLHIILQLR